MKLSSFPAKAIRFLFAGLTGLIVNGSPSAAYSIEKGSLVQFSSADGVELSARYVPGLRGGKSPAVIVLNDIGHDSQPDFCNEIVTELVSQGYAVLNLEFRGRGQSTAISPEFWNYTTNRKYVKGYRPWKLPETISRDDFAAGYLPNLVNDVAAAHAFLARRNDVGECNGRQIYLIGIGQGATIGQLWCVSEWSRFRTFGVSRKLVSQSEGVNIAGCVWVLPALSLDRQKMPMLTWLKKTSAKKTALTGIVYDSADRTTARFCSQAEQSLNSSRGGKSFVSSAIKLGADRSLLRSEGAKTEVLGILESMRKVQETPLWEDRNFIDRTYVWSLPGVGRVIAKEEGESEFHPIPYGPFLSGR